MHSETDDRRKGNGRDVDEDERKEQPWPDDKRAASARSAADRPTAGGTAPDV